MDTKKSTTTEQANVPLQQQISELLLQVRLLTDENLLLRQRLFGRSSEKKIETTAYGQISLFNEAEQECAPAGQETETEQITYHCLTTISRVPLRCVGRNSVTGCLCWSENTPQGADASAMFYSVIETAKENELKPYEYLKYILETAPNMDVRDPAAMQILLPWNAPPECGGCIDHQNQRNDA